MVKFEHFQ